ncbi:hypothetical protein ISCGN_024239 [Ixodes scapularis]
MLALGAMHRLEAVCPQCCTDFAQHDRGALGTVLVSGQFRCELIEDAFKHANSSPRYPPHRAHVVKVMVRPQFPDDPAFNELHMLTKKFIQCKFNKIALAFIVNKCTLSFLFLESQVLQQTAPWRRFCFLSCRSISIRQGEDTERDGSMSSFLFHESQILQQMRENRRRVRRQHVVVSVS